MLDAPPLFFYFFWLRIFHFMDALYLFVCLLLFALATDDELMKRLCDGTEIIEYGSTDEPGCGFSLS